MACKAAEIDVEFTGSSEMESAVDTQTGKTIVRINPDFYRPAEVDLLVGDATKAAESLGWSATTSLEGLCAMMVQADLQRNQD